MVWWRTDRQQGEWWYGGVRGDSDGGGLVEVVASFGRGARGPRHGAASVQPAQ